MFDEVSTNSQFVLSWPKALRILSKLTPFYLALFASSLYLASHPEPGTFFPMMCIPFLLEYFSFLLRRVLISLIESNGVSSSLSLSPHFGTAFQSRNGSFRSALPFYTLFCPSRLDGSFSIMMSFYEVYSRST